jgi:protein-tyrosine phosphatase
MEAEQGIGHVIATPHFYARHDTPAEFLQKRKEAEIRLREEMTKHEGLPQLSVGAEIYFFPGIADSDALWELTIDKNECIILEMPVLTWTESMYKEIEGISVKQGITPILAHIDRYLRPFQTYGVMDRLIDLPVLVQANANFFLKSSTRRTAMRLLREDRIHLLGSDCHNLSSRQPNMGPALETIEQRLGLEPLLRIEEYQRAVLQTD